MWQNNDILVTFKQTILIQVVELYDLKQKQQQDIMEMRVLSTNRI